MNSEGSSQLVTRADGSYAQAEIFFPFGGVRWSNGATQDVRYASMQERDSETETWQDPLDPTLNRLYGSGMGRWLSPEPAGLAAANPANPQSWNRYAYVLNNPTSLIDPLGLKMPDCDPDEEDCGPPACDFYDVSCDPGVPLPVTPIVPIGVYVGGGVGGGGGAGGGGAATAGGQTAESFASTLPCIPSQNLANLIPYIVAGLTQKFGNSPTAEQILSANPTLGGTNPSLPVEGGAAVFQIPPITPTQDFGVDQPMLPGFHPGQSSQVFLPVPEKPVGGGYGAGTTLHVTFNTTTNSAGQVTGITNVMAHFDIGNPFKWHGLGTPWHGLADLLAARIASAAQGGCAVKFQ